jgi:hypothetical protein
VKFINFRHLGALGLLAGWYLLTPPFAPGDPPGPLQINAPLSQWSRMDSSDTSSGCEEQRNNMVRMYGSGDMTSMATQFKLHLRAAARFSNPTANAASGAARRRPLYGRRGRRKC